MAIIQSYPTVTPTANDLVLIVDTSEDGNPTKTATVSEIISATPGGGAGSYDTYTALLTQTGSNPPVATVLNNKLTGTMTWARTGGGAYTITSSATPFTQDKTIVFLNGGNNAVTHNVTWNRVSSSVIAITTHNSDDRLTGASFEIRVYK
tara:strand:- start:255 stop:704 length:450 start_codon:yes stop_codon:yes gene_type:complete